LEPHDLVVSKMVAGRAKDYRFATALLKADLLDRQTLAERIELLPVEEPVKHRIREWLRGSAR
jgi:hypothetical protein